MADDDLSAQENIDRMGAAGGFDPDTYFGPKQQPAWLTQAQGVPPDAAGALDKAGNSGGMDAKMEKIISDLVSGQDKVNARGEQILGEEREGTRRMISSLEGDRQRMANIPQPNLEKTPPSPKANLGQGSMEWMQIATLIGAMGGAFVRRGTTTALTAFAGAIQGFAKGKMEDFNAKLDEWKAASEQVRQDNQERLDQYNSIMKNEKLSQDNKLSQFKLAASMWGDEMTFNAAQSKRLDVVASLLERQVQFNETYNLKQNAQALSAERIQAQLQMQKARLAILDTFQGSDRARVAALLKEARDKAEREGAPLPTATEEAQIALRYKSQTSSARALGTFTTKIETANKEFTNQVAKTLSASERVPRGDWQQFNSMAQAISYSGSDPNLIAFRTQLVGLRNFYTRAMNPTSNAAVGPMIETHFNQLLESSIGMAGLQEQVKQMLVEISNSRQAMQELSGELGGNISVDDGEEIFRRALEKEGTPNRTIPGGGQQGGSNVDPWNNITNFKAH